MSYQVIWEEQGVRVIYSENLINSDCINANLEFSSDPRFSSLKYIIFNYLSVDQMLLDTDLVKHLAAKDAELYPLNPNLKLALISDKEVVKGLLNIFSVYSEIESEGSTWEKKLFLDEEELDRWLN